jgi:hypothetical protein
VLRNHLNDAVIFLELSKAQNVLNHQILLVKLKNLWSKGSAEILVYSHLVNRIQFVEFEKIVSNNILHRYSSLYRETTYGVAQGSMLEPM